MPRRRRRTQFPLLGLAIGATLAALLVACSNPKTTPTTGANKEDPTFEEGQSETAVNFSVTGGKQILTVTYNDETGAGNGLIKYTKSTRTVSAGASMLGWSYSFDSGKTWKYGGKVSPPSGGILWGDPAITTDYADQRYVFISNLYIPPSNVPSGGIIGPMTLGGTKSPIAGACIVRSEDGGVSFKLHQCVDNQQHFYDGGSMASAGGSFGDRSVYASFVDVETARIDVWRSPTDTGVFSRLEDPFPGIPIFSHPRLRFDRDTDSLYVAALGANDGKIYVNRWNNGWGRPMVASWSTAGNPDIHLSDRTLRTGYQFSYDIGASSEAGGDSVRFLYTAKDPDSGRFYVRGSYCDFQLTKCNDAPEWGTTPGNFRLSGDQFNPSVRAFPGFFNIPPVWKITYLSRQDDPKGNKVTVEQGNLAVLPGGARSMVPFRAVNGLLVCGDTRGYWGDYNELQFAGFEKDSTTARFLMAFTDSSQGCEKQWTFTSHHVHVSTVMFT
ncbi:MAG: hypothetical protein QOG43_2108 [Actinomycetota bacterium]|jgi:hypothetical protein|nr:hypothetical protein [Actinomycetota bacterium]